VLVRALLGRILRDVGLDREAKMEGVAILNRLDRGRAASNVPRSAEPDKREVRAAALEAAGIDRSAAAVYAECIRVHLASLRESMSTGTVAFYRYWWVGQAYGRCMLRSGEAEQARIDLERKLAERGGSLGRMESDFSKILLAYIHEAQGRSEPASRLWSSLEGKVAAAGEPRVASRSVTP
jgi:hypothetical protein